MYSKRTDLVEANLNGMKYVACSVTSLHFAELLAVWSDLTKKKLCKPRRKHVKHSRCVPQRKPGLLWLVSELTQNAAYCERQDSLRASRASATNQRQIRTAVHQIYSQPGRWSIQQWGEAAHHPHGGDACGSHGARQVQAQEGASRASLAAGARHALTAEEINTSRPKGLEDPALYQVHTTPSESAIAASELDAVS